MLLKQRVKRIFEHAAVIQQGIIMLDKTVSGFTVPDYKLPKMEKRVKDGCSH
jgi:hypothetical protein